MNLMRKIGLVIVALMAASYIAGPVLAQDKDKEIREHELKKIETERKYSLVQWASPAWGAGIGAGLVIIGAAMGFGRIGSAALESMARQPETAGRVQTAMIIIGALLEGATFFALIVCIQLAGRTN
jgi:F-type H+-transporting ATPase subunit c